MIVAESANVIQASFADLWYTVIQYLPIILAAAIIFIIGWIVGMILGRIVEQIVQVLRLDDALRATGLHEAAKSAGFALHVGRFLGELVKWFIVVVFLVAALEVLGLTQVNIFLQQAVLLYLPQVIVAVLIIILAAIVAEVVKNLVVGSARAAGARSANLAGAMAKWSIWLFGILAALAQLGVAAAFVQTLFTGLVIALALAFGLAFGLGGQDAAASFLAKIRAEIKHD